MAGIPGEDAAGTKAQRGEDTSSGSGEGEASFSHHSFSRLLPAWQQGATSLEPRVFPASSLSRDRHPLKPQAGGGGGLFSNPSQPAHPLHTCLPPPAHPVTSASPPRAHLALSPIVCIPHPAPGHPHPPHTHLAHSPHPGHSPQFSHHPCLFVCCFFFCLFLFLLLK